MPRERLRATLARLPAASDAVLEAAFALSGVSADVLLAELLEDCAEVVGDADESSVSAGAVLLRHSSEATGLAERFTRELCLPLLRSGSSSAAQRVSTSLAAAVAHTGWSSAASLLLLCAESWAAPGQPLEEEAFRKLAAAGAKSWGDPLQPAAACWLASALLEASADGVGEPCASLRCAAASLLPHALLALGTGEHSPLDAALVRSLLPALVDCAGSSADETLHRHACRLLAGPPQAHRAALALLVRFSSRAVPPLPEEWRGGEQDIPFWRALRCALGGEDPRARKQALHLLRVALGPRRAASGGWAQLCVVLDCIEDYSMHLVTPAWLRLRALHPAASTAPQPPPLPADVPYDWVACLWCRAVAHENPTFRRQALVALAVSEWRGGYATALREEVLLGPLLLSLNEPANHCEGAAGAAAAAGVAAAAAARVAASPPSERAAAAHRVLAAIAAMPQLTRVGMAAVLEVARAASLAAQGSSELCGDASVELLRRLGALACSQWGAAYRGVATRAVLQAAAALAPPPHVGVAAAGRLLDALRGGEASPLRALAADWLASSDEQVAWLRPALSQHMAAFLRGDGALHAETASEQCTEEERTSWRNAARQGALVWSFLPRTAVGGGEEDALAPLRAAASSLYRRTHLPHGAALRALSLLEAVLSVSSADDAPPGLALAASELLSACVGEVAALARAACSGLCAPLSDDAPLLGTHSKGGDSYLGGPPSVLSPRRASCSHVACAALAVLALAARWRPADAAAPHAGAWREADAETWHLLCYLVGAANWWDCDGATAPMAAAAAELRDCALACASLAADALAPADEVSARGSPPPESVSADLGVALFAVIVRSTRDKQRSAGGGGSALGGATSSAGVRWRALAAALRMPGAASPSVAHADALGGAISAMAVSARGDAVHVLRAVRALLPIVTPHPELVAAATAAAATAAGDPSLTALDGDSEAAEHEADEDEVEECLLLEAEPLAPLACALARCAWAGFSDVRKRPVGVIAEFLATVFHPTLFVSPPLHARRRGPLRALTRRMLAAGDQSARIMRCTAAALWALWLRFPHVAARAHYQHEMARLCLYGPLDQDADFSEELLDPSAAAALRSMPGGGEVACAAAVAGEALAVRVTGVCGAHELARRGDAGEPPARAVGRALLRLVLRACVSAEEDLAAEVYRKLGPTHRRKVRAWQLLCALAPLLPREEDPELELVDACLWTALEALNLPNVKQYQEAFATAVMMRAPSLLATRVLPGLAAADAARPYTIASLALIGHAYVRHAATVEAQAAALPAVLAAVLPWAATHNHSLRVFAQVVLFELFDCFPLEHPAWAGADITAGPAGATLTAMRAFVTHNMDCVKTRAATGRVGAMHPDMACSPAAIFGAGPDCPYDVGERFEGAPTALVDRITGFLDELREGTRARQVEKEGAMLLGGSAVDASLEALHLDALQKKVDPSALYELEDTADGQCSAASADPRAARQDLILCASLVDKATNLGGLARTAEVFQLSRLVIGDGAVVASGVFKAMAVTADKWLPIAVVPPAALPAFLAAKRADGYALVGLEQTTGSVPLPGYSFPRRCVLVLGAEGFGIPAELLPLLDAAVEIPQPGKQVRSLNVHVSAALAVYEYTRQHCAAMSE